MTKSEQGVVPDPLDDNHVIQFERFAYDGSLPERHAAHELRPENPEHKQASSTKDVVGKSCLRPTEDLCIVPTSLQENEQPGIVSPESVALPTGTMIYKLEQTVWDASLMFGFGIFSWTESTSRAILGPRTI